MNTPEILPQPTSTYQLLLDAARTWPDSVATQWIPDPGDYTRCLAWTYADLARLGSLRLTLSVNGEVRQDSTAADMIVHPAQALTLLSRFQPMAPGDLLLTGTPGGTALKAPAKIAGLAAGLLPPATRWKLFFARQAANPRYLHDGDVITATIASPDGRLDLGTQHNTVIRKTP